MAALAAARDRARALSVTPTEAARFGLDLNRDGHRRSAFDLLSRPDIGIAEIGRIWPEFLDLAAPIAAQLEIDAKYAVYLDRQAADVAAFRRDEAFAIPDAVDYDAVPGLSNEARQKLSAARPRTIGHAARLDGITPAALTLLAAHVRRGVDRSCAPSPRLPLGRSRPSSTGYGEGRGEGALPQAQTRGKAPSPGAQVRADLSRERER
jgi:tRNA uridine 5-carboxymethylaminomethyl modification enzyme